MKIIIAGAGDVGLHLCKLLSNENHQVSIIDNREEQLKLAASYVDSHSYKGSSSSFEVLKNAKISECDLFIAVTNNEHNNINSCIIAKRLGAKKCICRIDNLEYLSEEKKQHFTLLGIDYMFYPEQIAANEIVNLIQQSVQSDTMTFGGGKLVLHVLRMDEDAPAIGQSVADFHNISQTPEFKIAGIVRNDKTFIPKLTHTIEENDLLYIVATQKGVELLTKYFGKKKENIRTVMIMGGSRIGINTARQLAMKQTVKLIEKDRTKSYEISNKLPGVLVINGDGRNMDLLLQEGIAHTDAFVAVTGDSEINMIACLLAKKLGVKKTIAEIENNDYIKLAENMDIDSVINKKTLSASKIFSFTMNDDVSSVNCLTCSDAEILEYIAKPDSKITQQPIAKLNLPEEVNIAGIIRGSECLIPEPNTQIRPFDKVIVFAQPSVINEISKYFKSSERFF